MFAAINAPTVRTARVLAVGTDGTVQLDLDMAETGDGVWARRAVPYEVAVGQLALVLSDADETWYVIGLLESSLTTATAHLSGTPLAAGVARPADGPAVRRVATATGACAEVTGPPGNEKLRVLSPHGELLFEHDPDRGVTRLAMPAGDLELLQPGGRITLAAAEIRLVGNEIDLHAARAARIAVPGVEAGSGTTLVADAQRLACRSGKLEATAARGDLSVEVAQVVGGRWSLQFAALSVAADSLETAARSVVEKAQNIYRHVAELLQVHAGRLRHYVAGSYHLKSEDAYLSTQKDFKVQAEQIHLG